MRGLRGVKNHVLPVTFSPSNLLLAFVMLPIEEFRTDTLTQSFSFMDGGGGGGGGGGT